MSVLKCDSDMVFCNAAQNTPILLTLSNFYDPRSNSEK